MIYVLDSDDFWLERFPKIEKKHPPKFRNFEGTQALFGTQPAEIQWIVDGLHFKSSSPGEFSDQTKTHRKSQGISDRCLFDVYGELQINRSTLTEKKTSLH